MSENQERNALHKRAKRYVQVASAAVKVGRSAAVSKVLGRDRREAEALMWRTILGNLKGPLMKIGQLLATIPDFLPEELASELMQLQSQAPSMGWPFVRRRMAGELGPDWQSLFRSFDKSAAAAASLGQVHKAVDLEGEAVACKLQYPDMASVVEADLAQLKIAFSLLEKMDKAVPDLEEPYEEIACRLREELSYNREAQNMALYASILANIKNIHVPAVRSALSTDRLLTMTWLEGEKLVDCCTSRSLTARNEIARNLFQAWYEPFYRYGVIHGDPHLGNYTVREDNSINLLDFGCIRVFRPTLIQAVIMLFHALREDDQDKAAEAYRLWGFHHLTKELLEVLSAWAKFVYSPVLQQGARSLWETNSTAQGRQIAASIHKKLREIEGITIPPEFVLIDRASVGLGSVFLRLNAEVDWFEVFDALTHDFDVGALARRQKKKLSEHSLSFLLEGEENVKPKRAR